MTIAPNDDGLATVANAICGCATKAQHSQDIERLKALRHAAMIEGARIGLEAAAVKAHGRCFPRNPMSDWTEYAEIRAECIASALVAIRALDPAQIIEEATNAR